MRRALALLMSVAVLVMWGCRETAEEGASSSVRTAQPGPSSNNVEGILATRPTVSASVVLSAATKGLRRNPKRYEPGPDVVESLAGHYVDLLGTTEPKSGLEGEDLYLFPDCSYIYVQWSDILLWGITDRGKWRYEDGYVLFDSVFCRFASNNLSESRYQCLPFLLSGSKGDRLMLLEMAWYYGHYLQDKKGRAGFVLSVLLLVRKDTITPEEGEGVKKDILARDAAVTPSDQGTYP